MELPSSSQPQDVPHLAMSGEPLVERPVRDATVVRRLHCRHRHARVRGFVFNAGRLPGWLLEDPARLAPVAWIAAAAVIAKYWIAAHAWRSVAPRYLRLYLVIWLLATISFLAFGVVL